MSRLGVSPGHDQVESEASAQTAQISYRERTGETLFIDARNQGSMLDRTYAYDSENRATLSGHVAFNNYLLLL